MKNKDWTEIIIGVLAIISIILVAVESLLSVSRSALITIYIADFVVCIIFAWDFIKRLLSSRNKLRFIKTNGYEIIAMIPAVAVYALGTVPAISTALRAVRLVRVVRVIIVLARMRRVMSRPVGFLQRSHLLAMLGVTVCVIFLGAYAVVLLESGTANAQINNFSDAIWWSISTVTTVGYGDIVPQSIAGRIMGMVLMVVGIGVMTAFISQVSAALVESRMKRQSVKSDLKTDIIKEIKSRIDNIDNLSEDETALLIQTLQSLRLKGTK